MEQRQRIGGYDVMRTMAIFMVVAIHASSMTFQHAQGSAGWYAMLLFRTLCTVSVPLFFMISGALLLSDTRQFSLKEHYRKRVWKQFLPFAVWSLIYTAAKIALGKAPLSVGTFLALLKEPAYAQFWFMLTLLGIYLILPLVKIFTENASKKMLEYALIIWVVFSSLIPLICFNFYEIGVREQIDLVISGGYLGYFILGYYLKRYYAQTNKKKCIAILCGAVLLMWAAAIVEWIVFSHIQRKYNGYFASEYLTPFTIVASAAIFLLLKDVRLKEKTGAVLKQSAVISIGIFYIHMLVLTAVENYVFTSPNLPSFFAKLFVSYIASGIIAFVISKIPIIKRIFMGL